MNRKKYIFLPKDKVTAQLLRPFLQGKIEHCVNSIDGKTVILSYVDAKPQMLRDYEKINNVTVAEFNQDQAIAEIKKAEWYRPAIKITKPNVDVDTGNVVKTVATASVAELPPMSLWAKHKKKIIMGGLAGAAASAAAAAHFIFHLL